MKMKKLLMAMVLLPVMALADTETVDGITWTYFVSNGQAEVRSGYYSSAIPATTTGAINIPLVLGGKPVTSIGNYAFYSCSGLTAVTIPSSVTRIGESAFYYCSGLTELMIPSGVTHIGNYAFERCSGLRAVTLPRSVTDLGYSVFYGCTGLESVSLPFVGSRRGSGGNFSSLFGSGSVPATLTTVAITDDSTVPPYAFQNCRYLENITLPIGMSSIGNGAFQGCESLRSVSLPVGVSEIGSYAFQRCLSLTEVTIPVGVQQLESSVFDECLSLSKVTLPVGLTSIGYGAFRNCRSLSRVNIPNAVTSIAPSAFAGCTGLGSGVVVVDRCLLTVAGKCPANVVVDQDVRLIVGGAFSECESLQSVTINTQLEELPDDLFEYCSNLRKVVLPASLRVIGGWAFFGCHSLEDIQLPEGLVEIQEGAFAGCSSMRTFHVPASVTQLASLPTGRWDEDDETWIPSRLSQLTVAVGNKVYAAYNNMLYSKSGRILIWCLPSAVSISIRSGTKYIAGGAFQGCSKLTQLTIPEGVVALGNLWDWFEFEEGYYPDDYLALLVDEDYLPNLNYNDEGSMFSGCSSLQKLSLPSTLASVDEYAFDELPALSSLTVASGNRKYAAYDNVFYDQAEKRLLRCPLALKAAKIWDKTETIASYAFDGCDKLESLTIPASVKKIGTSPFWGCEKLKAVYYKGNAPFPLYYSYCSPGEITWEDVGEEELPEIQKKWILYALGSSGCAGCGCGSEPEIEYLSTTSYVQRGTKWWGDSGEWQGRPLVFVDNIENPVVRFMVSFDPGEGETPVESVRIEKGKAVGPLPTPVWPRYKFLGWYTAAEGGTKISSTTKVTGDVTYYAHWQFDGSAPVVVRVAEDCAELGSVSGGNKTFKAGDRVTLKATAKKGAAFAYWECADGSGSRSPSYTYVATGEESELRAYFVRADEDGLSVGGVADEIISEVDEALDGGVSVTDGYDDEWTGQDLFYVETGSAATITVKGLPPGVKFTMNPLDFSDANVYCTGAPTKEGVYWVTCTAKNGNGYQSSATIKWVVGAPPETDYDDIGFIFEEIAYLEEDGFFVGREIYTCLNANLKSVVGLPTGLKFQPGSSCSGGICTACSDFIRGTLTKAGKFTMTFTDRYNRKAVKTVVVQDSGSAYLHVSCGEGYEDRGTVTGFGVYAVGAKVKLSAKPASGYYFAGWYSDSGCEDRLYLDSGDWRKASDSYQTGVDDWPEIYAKFVSKEEDADIWIGTFGDEVEETGEDEDTWFVRAEPVPGGDNWGECFFEAESETLPAITVSGLPSGCMWDKKTNRLYFPKQPAKPGLIKATIKARNLSGVVKTRTLYVKVPNLQSDVFAGLDYESDYRVTQGVSDACVESWCSFEVEEGWRVTASGLPPGLKFALEQDWGWSRGRIYGTSTKAGAYTVTLTAKRGGETQKATVTFVVNALPDYVVGKFSGLLQNGDENIGTFALTATAAGKLSVSLVMKDGTRKTYSANSWNCAYDGVYAGYFTKKAASGSCAEDGESVYFEVGPDYAWDQHQLFGNFVIDPCRYGGVGEIVAQRNPFGKVGNVYENVEAHSVAAEFAGYGKMGVWVEKADDGEYWLECLNCVDRQNIANPPLAFTVNVDGTVKIAGKLAGKSVNGSTTLRILDGESQADFVLSVSKTPIVIHVDFCRGCGGANGAVTGWATVGW